MCDKLDIFQENLRLACSRSLVSWVSSSSSPSPPPSIAGLRRTKGVGGVGRWPNDTMLLVRSADVGPPLASQCATAHRGPRTPQRSAALAACSDGAPPWGEPVDRQWLCNACTKFPNKVWSRWKSCQFGSKFKVHIQSSEFKWLKVTKKQLTLCWGSSNSLAKSVSKFPDIARFNSGPISCNVRRPAYRIKSFSHIKID